MQANLKVGIIGAGRIASGFDTPDASLVLTHAHAVLNNPTMELIGFYDISSTARCLAASKWSCASFNSLEELIRAAPDLIIIAVPDPLHEDYLKALIKYRPRLVICEKPLKHGLASAQKVVRMYSEAQIPLLVNYQRRFDPDIIELKSRIESGYLGRPLGGTVLYSKGTKHNGSHAIDLLRFLFGEPNRLMAFGCVVDFHADDPSVSGRLEFPSVDVNIQAMDERLFSIFEIDLLFERGRYRFTHSGLDLEISEPKPDPVFSGYCELSVVEARNSGLARNSLANLMFASSQYLLGGMLPSNTAADAIKTQAVCERLIEAARKLS